MRPWLKKLVLVAALLVMPLQGVAATLSVLICHGDAKAHALHAPGHDRIGHHGSQQDEGGTPGNDAFHPCCHYTVSVIPVVTPPAVLPDFPVRAFAPDTLPDLFVPEQPQRPPLA